MIKNYSSKVIQNSRELQQMRPLDYVSPREIIKELKQNPNNQIRLPKSQLELDREKEVKPRPKIKKFVLTKPAVWHDHRDEKGAQSAEVRAVHGEITATEIKLPVIMPSRPFPTDHSDPIETYPESVNVILNTDPPTQMERFVDQPYADHQNHKLQMREAKGNGTKYNSLSPQMYREYEHNYGNNLEK